MKTERCCSLSAAILAMVVLVACSPESAIDEFAMSETPVSGIVLDTVSTKPWLVTGGEVLVEASLASDLDPASLRLQLNGENITNGFRRTEQGNVQAFITTLREGDNTLLATVPGSERRESLEMTNYPVSGPIISGPHETPFYCQTNEFELVTGDTLGESENADCSVETRVDYVYFSAQDNEFKAFNASLGAEADQNIAEVTTLDGRTVPFIVRVETGTVNRAIYEIAMLHNPAEPSPDPWTRSSGWNGKLVYTHGGGCRSGWYQQGDRTGGVLREGLLEMGFALTSASLNVFGQNCNDLLASETHLMVKERFIEHYGVPTYTIATGSSGGSYQSHQTADNYPGVFDGIIVASSFPDVTSATIFTLADARLLHHYFTQVDPDSFDEEQQLAVSGFGSWGSIPNLSGGAARLDPLFDEDVSLEEQGGEVSIDELESLRYSPTDPDGVRATVYDHTVNVYGRDPVTGFANRPLDNVGVQYGLAALNEGRISKAQFIELNRGIGGFDRDMNHVDQRHRADALAARRAIESGRILYGGAGLAATPVIDYRTYTDHREGGDIHMIVHQFSTRQRLIEANGNADNHVMNVGGRWGFTEEAPDLGNLFRQMDRWLTSMHSRSDGRPARDAMLAAKPEGLVDNCWDDGARGETRENMTQQLDPDGSGRCGELFPVYSTPRQIAGAPLANNIVSCSLKSVDPSDYAVSLSDQELASLQEIFPDGVCDWTQGDSHGTRHQGSWLSFGPSPVNLIQ